MKISLHQVSNDVNIVIVISSFRSEDVQKSDDIIVLEEFLISMVILRSLISLTILFASIRSSNALIT